MTAGGHPASRVARWDGSTWSALGVGVDGQVSALAVSGTDVYAGGFFATAGGGSASFVARWNGSAWSQLTSGTNAQALALATSGANVYVGGVFSIAGGGAAAIRPVERQRMVFLGRRSTPGERCLRSPSTAPTCAGGSFVTAGPRRQLRRQKNGSVWSSLGLGATISPCARVTGNDLYVAAGYRAPAAAFYRVHRQMEWRQLVVARLRSHRYSAGVGRLRVESVRWRITHHGGRQSCREHRQMEWLVVVGARFGCRRHGPVAGGLRERPLCRRRLHHCRWQSRQPRREMGR